MKKVPLITTAGYVTLFLAVFVNNVFWPVGDDTDVIRVGLAALPASLLTAPFAVGNRNEVFALLAFAATLNTVGIYVITRFLVSLWQRRKARKP